MNDHELAGDALQPPDVPVVVNPREASADSQPTSESQPLDNSESPSSEEAKQSSPVYESGKRSSRRTKKKKLSKANPATRQASANDAYATLAPPSQAANSEDSKATPRKTDRYSTLNEVGRGGWGVVERAFDHQLDREVAVKRLGTGATNESAPSSDIRSRFLHEAKVTSQLQHPNIVPVHELGDGIDGGAFYVMKLLPGQSFRDHLRQRHAETNSHEITNRSALRDVYLPLLERFIDVCNAVAFAHRRGVIHRDLKPANVMIGEFGETIVVDWGLAKRIDNLDEDSEPVASSTPAGTDPYATLSPLDQHGSSSEQYDVTSHGSVIGTPAYMPPEQAEGRVADLTQQSDIYSLGVILFELITGKTPMSGCDLGTMLELTCSDKVPRLREKHSAAPKSLEAVCAKAMAFSPELRYATAEDLAEDVKRFMAGDEVSVHRDPWQERLLRWCRRNQTLAFACLTGLVVLLIASLVFGGVIRRAHLAEAEARRRAEEANRSAHTRLVQARESADSWLIDLSGALEFYPGMEPIRADLIDKAITQYVGIVEKSTQDSTQIADPELQLQHQLEIARANLRLGDLLRLRSGDGGVANRDLDLGKADEHYHRAYTHLLDLRSSLPPSSETSVASDLAFAVNVEALNAQIGLALANSSADEAHQSVTVDPQLSNWLEREVASLEGLINTEAVEQPLINDAVGKVISVYARLQIVEARRRLEVSKVTVDQTESLQRALELTRWLSQNRGRPSDHRLSQSTADELQQCYVALGRSSETAEIGNALVQDLSTLVEREPARVDLKQSLAFAQMNQAERLAAMRFDSDASRLYGAAIDELSEAWNLLDADRFFRTNLAAANHNHGRLLADDAGGNPQTLGQSRQDLENAIRIYANLLQAEVTEDVVRRISECHLNLARVKAQLGEASQTNNWESAVAGFEMLVDNQLENTGDQVHLLTARIGQARLAQMHVERSRVDELLVECQRLSNNLPASQATGSHTARLVLLDLLQFDAEVSESREDRDRAQQLQARYEEELVTLAEEEATQPRADLFPAATLRLLDYYLEVVEDHDQAAALCKRVRHTHPNLVEVNDYLQREAIVALRAGNLDLARQKATQCQADRPGNLIDRVILELAEQASGATPNGDLRLEILESAAQVPNDVRLQYWATQLVEMP